MAKSMSSRRFNTLCYQRTSLEDETPPAFQQERALVSFMCFILWDTWWQKCASAVLSVPSPKVASVP